MKFLKLLLAILAVVAVSASLWLDTVLVNPLWSPKGPSVGGNVLFDEKGEFTEVYSDYLLLHVNDSFTVRVAVEGRGTWLGT